MNFPFFIARRYLFAKKSHNVINVISAISVAGIMLASFALICTLSVFNGFHELVESLFKDFDPELKVVSTDHKFFKTDDEKVNKACNLDFIDICTFTLEEQALLSYKSKQQICMIKGVEDSYHDLVGIENLLKGSGIFMLQDEVCNYGIMGIGLMNKMDCGVKPAYPLRLAVPKKQGNISLSNPAASFNQASIYSPGTVFCVEQEKYDDNYVIISLPLAQQLTDREGEASAMEIKLTDGYSLRKARRELESVLGPEFKVQDRLLQQQDVFKVFKLEKLISYLFFGFFRRESKLFERKSPLYGAAAKKQTTNERRGGHGRAGNRAPGAGGRRGSLRAARGTILRWDLPPVPRAVRERLRRRGRRTGDLHRRVSVSEIAFRPGPLPGLAPVDRQAQSRPETRVTAV